MAKKLSRTPKAEQPQAPEQLTPVLDGAFELVNIKPIKINTGFGDYDLGNLSEKQALFLVEKGFKFIRKV